MIELETSGVFSISRRLSGRSSFSPFRAAETRGEAPHPVFLAGCGVARGQQFPRLCANGLRPGKGKPGIPVDADQVETAIAFLSHFKPIKTGRVNSYSIKHAAERWGARNGMSSYVSNGAAIAAALLHLGFVVEEYPTPWFLDPSPNALIGIGLGEFKRFIAEGM